MKCSIICIGNRFVPGDDAGLRVFDQLRIRPDLPQSITLIEGGLAGLNLLPLLEGGGRIVFVDAVHGFDAAGGVVIVEHNQIIGSTAQLHFDHNAGLPYLLAVLPRVCDGELPKEIVLVGLEGACSNQMIEHAADIAVTVATHGVKGLA